MRKDVMIRVDANTHGKLKAIAGDKSLNQLLAEMVEGVEDPVEVLRRSLLKQLEAIQQQISTLDKNTTALIGELDHRLVTQEVKMELVLHVIDKLIPGAKQAIDDDTPKMVDGFMNTSIRGDIDG